MKGDKNFRFSSKHDTTTPKMKGNNKMYSRKGPVTGIQEKKNCEPWTREAETEALILW
jgi:hypothetical protein